MTPVQVLDDYLQDKFDKDHIVNMSAGDYIKNNPKCCHIEYAVYDGWFHWFYAHLLKAAVFFSLCQARSDALHMTVACAEQGRPSVFQKEKG